MKEKLIILGFILIVIIAIVFTCNESSEEAKQESSQTMKEKNPGEWNQLKNLIANGKDIGVIKKVSTPTHEAWVNEYQWRVGLDAEAKENLAIVLAKYCGYWQNTDAYFISIFDGQSGRKLAKYSVLLGFKAY